MVSTSWGKFKSWHKSKVAHGGFFSANRQKFLTLVKRELPDPWGKKKKMATWD